MSERRHFLWSVNLLRALAESWGVGAILLFGLLLVADRIPSTVLGQSALFLSPLSAFWCALRLRLSAGRWWKQVLREAAAALGLSLALGGLLPGLVFVAGRGDRIGWATPGSLGVALILAASGLAFGGFRLGVWLWQGWNRLRRRRMVWALTHAHLTVVVILVLLVAVLIGAQVVRSSSDVPARFSPEWGAAFVDLLARTIFPFLVIVGALLILLLVILLPPSALFSYLVARRTTRRLESLAAAAMALRRGVLSTRVAVEGEDEVAQLQLGFNTMAADLEQATDAIQAERDKVLTLLESRRDLIANVSHELRTPVATLRGYLDSALAGSDAPADLRQDLEVMAREVERLQGLIDDLFTLARAEVDGLTLDVRPIDAGRIVRERVEAMASLAWQAGRVQVVAEVPSDLPHVPADPERLAQVLINLLRNGVRHTEPGGIVAVVAAAEPEHVRIEVRDTGAGIPSEELGRVWERFYRGTEARTRDRHGAGLGLALVKELTEAMGGTVAVESELGRGSCFTLRFPLS